MPWSHHSHSGQFCRHAKGTLEEVVEEAIGQGFRTYGLSEHVPRYREQDLYPEEKDLQPSALTDTFTAYLSHASALRERYASRINLIVGLETENIVPATLDALEELLASDQALPPGERRIDYVVGSVHHVNEVPFDFSEQEYDRAIASFASEDERAEGAGAAAAGVSGTTPRPSSAAFDRFLSAYFDLQYHVLTRIRPEVVGHFDLCLLFRPEHSLKAQPEVWAKVERNVRYAVGYGALFEVNAAAFRKGWRTAYPGKEVMELILSLKGRLCLSDDSHGPHTVGAHYASARDYLLSLGVDELWHLERELWHLERDSAPAHDQEKEKEDTVVVVGSPFPRGTRPRRVGPEWRDAPFWDGRHPP